MGLTLKQFYHEFRILAKKLEIKYNDIEIYKNAFTHTSFANEHHLSSNERLEFIGDAILDFLVGEYLFKTYPEMPEGEMTKTRAIYVCAEANNNYALKLSLDKLLLLGKGEEEQGGRSRQNVLADLFEAFLGAIYIDTHDISKVKEILEKVVFPSIVIHKVYLEDYKSRLQELIQAENRKSVTYVLEREEGPSHDKIFTTAVYFEGVKLGCGIGKSKKDSEQLAAKEALEKLVK